ncbi:hypothetical protein ILUMI_23523 [Ignelater luminosus]|uniref:Uncharacterized protein n=1 Tax=Ignelater luminosus TaxID=2038154 RepID=A0A8K0G1U1_IGNLU|nr:hypothetical protein ILUMI_23523 [Ignelater luminosus]
MALTSNGVKAQTALLINKTTPIRGNITKGIKKLLELTNQEITDVTSMFIGANNKFHELFKSSNFESEVTNVLKRDKICWHFILPCIPNFGGIWEARVKAVKVHLKKNNDPMDLQALTPDHLLSETPLNFIPEADLTSLPPGRLLC